MISSKRYQPTSSDLTYRNFVLGAASTDPFERAVLLRDVSDSYLIVLASDNTAPSSAGIKAFYDAELVRRGGLVARRANQIALWSLGISVLSFLAAVIAILVAI